MRRRGVASRSRRGCSTISPAGRAGRWGRARGRRRVRAPQPLGRVAAAERLTLCLRGQRRDYGKLMEVRAVIEVENAGLAAERGSAEQLDGVRAAGAQMRVGLTREEEALADVEFHRAIATATG